VNDEMIESVSWHPEERSLLVALSTKATNATKDNGKYFVVTMKTAEKSIHWQCSNQHPLITEKAVHNNDLPPSCRS
ncbi:MAG: hypothetical protein GQ569_10160, partial [Methylococcaceae bacterium]|nr:hypothetical protein [Methylococcaceae bacterium]